MTVIMPVITPPSANGTAPQTLAQQVHDRAQNLASELRRFRRDWPYFPQLAQFEYVVSNDLLAALGKLTTDLRQFHYATPTPVVGDQQWLDKLSKLQERVPRVEPAAALLRELFPRAEGLKAQCERLLAASKWTVEFQLCLRTVIDGAIGQSSRTGSNRHSTPQHPPTA